MAKNITLKAENLKTLREINPMLLSYNVENFAESIRKDVTVVMFLKGDTTSEDEEKIKKVHRKFTLHMGKIRI